MMTEDRLSALSWEPCILKHKARYDNPWTDTSGDFRRRKARIEGGLPKINTAIPLRVENLETGEVQHYQSYYKCSQEIGVQHRDLKECVYKGRIYKKIFRVTLDTPQTVSI